MLAVYNLIRSTYPTMFAKTDKLPDKSKEDLIYKLFGGNKNITMSEVNHLTMMVNNDMTVFNTIFSFVDNFLLMIEHPQIYIPLYIRLDSNDGVKRKEYIEMDGVEALKGEMELSARCLVVPIFIGMERTDIFEDIEEILYNSMDRYSKEIDQTSYWESLLMTFWPTLVYPQVNTNERLFIVTNQNSENDFILPIGRYNITNSGFVAYIGATLYLEKIIEGKVNLSREVINLRDGDYKQEILNNFYSSIIETVEEGYSLKESLDKYRSSRLKNLRSIG